MKSRFEYVDSITVRRAGDSITISDTALRMVSHQGQVTWIDLKDWPTVIRDLEELIQKWKEKKGEV